LARIRNNLPVAAFNFRTLSNRTPKPQHPKGVFTVGHFTTRRCYDASSQALESNIGLLPGLAFQYLTAQFSHHFQIELRDSIGTIKLIAALKELGQTYANNIQT